MFDVALYGMCLLYPFEGGESPRLLVFRRDVVNAIFLKYSKKERLSSNRVGIRNIPLDVCYDETLQVQSVKSKAGVTKCRRR